jgi:hypothetical protein
VTTDSEVRAHLGVGYGSFARAQLGRLFDEAPIVPVVLVPPQPALAQAINTPGRVFGGGASLVLGWDSFAKIAARREAELTDTELLRAAEEAREIAQTPELQTWVSSTLSRAGRRGRTLTTDRSVADVLLRAVQGQLGAPLARTVQLSAGYVALGYPTNLVGHGDDLELTRALAAVCVDDDWAYADPHGDLPLGAHAPFVSERFYSVPDLETPEAVGAAAEVGALREELATIRAEVAGLQEALRVARAGGWKTLAEALNSLTPEERASVDWTILQSLTPEQRARIDWSSLRQAVTQRRAPPRPSAPMQPLALYPAYDPRHAELARQEAVRRLWVAGVTAAALVALVVIMAVAERRAATRPRR